MLLLESWQPLSQERSPSWFTVNYQNVVQQGRIWAGSLQLSFVSAQAPPGHSVCPSLVQGTDVFPCFGMAFVLTARSRTSTCSLTQLLSCRSQARVTAWLGFGWDCSLDSESLFLARGRKHREGQKCTLHCSCRLHRNLPRSCRREVCPQEGKDDPVFEIIWF